MNPLDIILIIAIAVWLFMAIRNVKKGGCSSCKNCNHCDKCSKNHTKQDD